MAEYKSYLHEPMLTQQEQVALRTCTRVTTLAEGLIQLEKLKTGPAFANSNATATPETLQSINEIEQYLKHRITTTLATYKAPVLPQLGNKDSKQGS